MPPMNTFLNRLLALRIADQNSLFAAFDQILSSILERAAASGALDRGMEDIVADDVVIVRRGGDPHRRGHGRRDQAHHASRSARAGS